MKEANSCLWRTSCKARTSPTRTLSSKLADHIVVRSESTEICYYHRPREGDSRAVVYVSAPGFPARKAESILKSLGHPEVRCFLDGIAAWIEAGGEVDFPKGVKFEVGHECVKKSSVLIVSLACMEDTLPFITIQ